MSAGCNTNCAFSLFSSYPSNRLVWSMLDFYVRQLLIWSYTIPQREQCLICYCKSPTPSLTSVCEHSNEYSVSIKCVELLSLLRKR